MDKYHTSKFIRIYGKTLKQISMEMGFSEGHIHYLHNNKKLPLKRNRGAVEVIPKKLLKCWKNAHGRCTIPTTNKYEYYGGRGIKFDLKIEDAYKIWKRDGGDKLKQPTIDRIDSDGNYVKENCRFIEFSKNREGRVYKSRGLTSVLKNDKITSELNETNIVKGETRVSNQEAIEYLKEMSTKKSLYWIHKKTQISWPTLKKIINGTHGVLQEKTLLRLEAFRNETPKTV